MKIKLITAMFCLFSTFAITADNAAPRDAQRGAQNDTEATAKPSTAALATFAGGCFWCMEPPFDKLDGVLSTTSGYAGGHINNPSYKQVSAGVTGHTEVVQIEYDPSKINYEQLLQVFWLNIDPTVWNRQFCDRGSQYRSAIFFHDEDQRKLAETSLAALSADAPFEGQIHTEINAYETFFPAEDYHQDYYLRNPIRYKFYRNGCGRDKRLKQIWRGAKQAFSIQQSVAEPSAATQ